MQRIDNPIAGGPTKNARTLAASFLDISPSPDPACRLDSAGDISLLASMQYGKPSRKNFPTVDSFKAPNLIFQMTVSAEHDINIDGLLAVAEAVPRKIEDPPLRVYFVVPPTKFAEFKIGSFFSSRTPKSKPAQLSDIEFWVLQLFPIVGMFSMSHAPSPFVVNASVPLHSSVAATQHDIGVDSINNLSLSPNNGTHAEGKK